MQKLIMPINHPCVTAGYKSKAYHQAFGFPHFGMDIVDTDRQCTNIYALGDGKVVACGMDGRHTKDRLGNCIVVIYEACELNDGLITDLACRMYHFDKIFCKVGQKIKKGDVLGLYGNTGAYSNGAHLHIEFDTDTQYPQYAVGIAKSGNIIKKGTVDSTINPNRVFWRDSNQTNPTFNAENLKQGWLSNTDIVYPPRYEQSNAIESEYKNALDELARAKSEKTKIIEEIMEVVNKYKM